MKLFQIQVKRAIREKGLPVLAKLCGVTTRTLRLWARGTITPNRVTRIGFLTLKQ